MMMNPKISVIIPVYNSGRYIKDCLDSLLSQTYTNFEIILVNDGSTDDSEMICSDYARRYENIILINQINQGVDKARNAALSKCSGEYIGFIDSDDYVEPSFLEAFVDALQKNPSCDWVIQGIVIDYTDNLHKVTLEDGYYTGADILASYIELGNKFVNGFLVNKLFKKSIVYDNHLMFRFTLKEDLLFNMEYCKYVSSMAVVSDAYYHYIQRGNQSLIHKRYSALYMQELITSLKDAGIALSQHYSNEDYRKSVMSDFILSFSVLLLSMYNRKVGVVNRKKRVGMIREYHSIRKSNKDISIYCNDKKKLLFASLAMAPSCLLDLLLQLLSPIINKI
jgi:glycosyltransferase involved in cell wall biosynthesis